MPTESQTESSTCLQREKDAQLVEREKWIYTHTGERNKREGAAKILKPWGKIKNKIFYITC